jgi:hypothetical protein
MLVAARRAGVWRTADAPDISHPAGSGRGGGALSDLCFRSKAVWGYDAGFMALKRDAAGGAATALIR